MTWLIALLSIAGTILNIQRKRSGFALWMITNAFWVVYDLSLNAPAQALLFAVYFGTSVYGFRAWSKGGAA